MKIQNTIINILLGQVLAASIAKAINIAPANKYLQNKLLWTGADKIFTGKISYELLA